MTCDVVCRARGHEPACKEAVRACIDAAREINRQAADIAGDLDPLPQFNIKVIVR